MDKGICSIPTCDEPAKTRGWCPSHYMRWWCSGDVRADVPLRTKDVEQRFLEKVNKNGPLAKNHPELGCCWLWLSTTSSTKGAPEHGIFWADGRRQRAHRWAYEHWVGAIPDGLEMDHFACDRRNCVNPSHVRPVTRRENALRGEGQGSLNLAKTHCKHGHEFTPENIYWINGGRARLCRTCAAEAQRKKQATEAHKVWRREYDRQRAERKKQEGQT